MTRWLETDTNTNINISAATLVGTYTADADRLILPQLLVDQAAGGGDYVYYITLQVAGAGSAYVFGPKTTQTAAAGETALGAQGGLIAVRNGDVVKVYVDGLAGDTATPDTTVRWFELAALRPTASDRTLDVSATGTVTPDGGQINSVSSTISANVVQMNGDTDPVDNLVLAIESDGYIRANLVRILGTTLTETAGLIAAAFSKFFNKAAPTGTVNSLPDAVAGAVNGLAIVGSEMDLVDAPNATAIAAIQANLTTLGSGAITFTYTLASSVDATPISDADVWVTTDSAGSNVIAVGRTNAAGQVVFYLDAGPVYVWRQKTGWTFANPDTEVVA